jgi:hypothetical protein
MKLTEARNLVDNALAEDTAAAQVVLRDMCKNYRYRVPAVLAEAIFEKSVGYKGYLKDADRFDSLMRMVNLAVWTNIARQHIAEIDELIFVALQHASGKVRQKARALSENYARFLIGPYTEKPDKDKPDALEFLYHLERLIKEYQPEDIPIYIDKVAPSVYKSLVMTWHETMRFNRLWERLNYQERMVELEIPGYSDPEDEDNTPKEADYPREEWKDHLEEFVICDDWPRARQLLDGQEKLAITLLKQALSDNSVDSKYCQRIIKLARSSQPSRLADEVLTEVGADIWSKYEESKQELVFRTDKIARALQTIDNNAVVKTTKGHPFSRMISCSAGIEAWRTKRDKIDLVPLLEGFAASHLAVDDIITELLLPADKKMGEFYKELKADPPSPTDFATPKQVVHYVLDWLIQIDYRLFLRKTPQQMAAVVWHIVGRRNPGLMLYGLENRSLAEFGGWPTGSGLTQLSQRLNIELEQDMADPFILCLVPPEYDNQEMEIIGGYGV